MVTKLFQVYGLIKSFFTLILLGIAAAFVVGWTFSSLQGNGLGELVEFTYHYVGWTLIVFIPATVFLVYALINFAVGGKAGERAHEVLEYLKEYGMPFGMAGTMTGLFSAFVQGNIQEAFGIALGSTVVGTVIALVAGTILATSEKGGKKKVGTQEAEGLAEPSSPNDGTQALVSSIRTKPLLPLPSSDQKGEVELTKYSELPHLFCPIATDLESKDCHENRIRY